MCSLLRNISSEVWWTSPLREKSSQGLRRRTCRGTIHAFLIHVCASSFHPLNIFHFRWWRQDRWWLSWLEQRWRRQRSATSIASCMMRWTTRNLTAHYCFGLFLKTCLLRVFTVCLSRVCVVQVICFSWFCLFVFFFGLFSFFHRVLTLAERHPHTHPTRKSKKLNHVSAEMHTRHTHRQNTDTTPHNDIMMNRNPNKRDIQSPNTQTH